MGTIVVLVLTLTLLTYLVPDAPGFLKVALLFSIGLSFWGDKLGRAGKWVQRIAVLISFVLFVGSWGFTKWFAQSSKHGLQMLMASESETVDPESPLPKPGEKDTGFMKKFMVRPDGVIEPVDITWVRNKYTGAPLAEPGSEEYWMLLNKYYRQKAELEATKKTSRVVSPAIVQLTPENPVGAFKAGPGQQTAEYKYPANWSPSDFEVVITEGTGTVVVNHKYRVEGAVPGDKRLDDLRGVGIVPAFESIVSYQIIGGPITGLVKTSW